MQESRRNFVRQLAGASSLVIGAGLPIPGRSADPRAATSPRTPVDARSRSAKAKSKGDVSRRLPAFVPRPGEFSEFTLNTPASVGCEWTMLANWCGGTFVPDFGAMGAAVYHGGGEHSAWADKGGVLVLDVAERKYVMRNVPAIQTNIGVDVGGNGSPTDIWGAFANNGYPQRKHTYNCLCYMPAANGGGPMGSLLRVGHSGGLRKDTKSAGLAATWKFDLSQANDGCTRLNGDTPYLIYRDKPTDLATTNDSPVACFDTIREGAWHYGRTPGAPRGLSFTHRSGRVDNWAAPPLALTNWSSLHHMPDDDLLCAICDEPGGQLRFGAVRLLNLSALPNAKWQMITPNIPDDPAMQWGVSGVGSIQAGYTGAQWSTLLGAFVAFDYGSPHTPTTTIRVWVLTPPPPGRRFTGTWSWRVESVTSADGSTMNVRKDPASQNGAFGKLVECPALRSLVWTRGPDKRGQLIRLIGME